MDELSNQNKLAKNKQLMADNIRGREKKSGGNESVVRELIRKKRKDRESQRHSKLIKRLNGQRAKKKRK